MNFTTYDEIFECFLKNTGIDTTRLPTTDEAIYAIINNGVSHYNVYLKDEVPIKCDDSSETINVTLDSTRLLILAYCIKYVYLENQLVGFEELWSPFQNDLGIKNYKSQIQARQDTLDRTKQMITQLLTSTEDASIM